MFACFPLDLCKTYLSTESTVRPEQRKSMQHSHCWEISTVRTITGTTVVNTANPNVQIERVPEPRTRRWDLSDQPSPSTTFLSGRLTMVGMSPTTTPTVQRVEHKCRVKWSPCGLDFANRQKTLLLQRHRLVRAKHYVEENRYVPDCGPVWLYNSKTALCRKTTVELRDCSMRVSLASFFLVVRWWSSNLCDIHRRCFSVNCEDHTHASIGTSTLHQSFREA